VSACSVLESVASDEVMGSVPEVPARPCAPGAGAAICSHRLSLLVVASRGGERTRRGLVLLHWLWSYGSGRGRLIGTGGGRSRLVAKRVVTALYAVLVHVVWVIALLLHSSADLSCCTT